MSDNYEFSNQENEKLQDLVKNIRGFVPPMCVFTFLQVFLAFGHHNADGDLSVDPYATLLAVVTSVFSIFILKASQDFQKIIDTEGSDIEHLMSALSRVRTAMQACTVLLLLSSFLLLGSIIEILRS